MVYVITDSQQVVISQATLFIVNTTWPVPYNLLVFSWSVEKKSKRWLYSHVPDIVEWMPPDYCTGYDETSVLGEMS